MGEQEYSLLDIHLARFLADRSRLSGEQKDQFQRLVQGVSSSLGAGHSCLVVSGEEEQILQLSPLVSTGGNRPLVLYNGRLYLHRYFHYEQRLAEQLNRMSAATRPSCEQQAQARAGSAADRSPDPQLEAVRLARQNLLTIIHGGPGTGKTTTVVKILVGLLQELSTELQIVLGAPTGKAAMRLSESIGASLARMELPQPVRDAIPVDAVTLHRLMGVRRNSPQFIHCCDNPLGWDVVVVDEASMVDLAMMSKLVDSLKPGSMLLLLGDKDQLASVESGAVLSDLIRSLPENSVELKKTYRFDENISTLATSINSGNSALAWQLLTEPSAANVVLLSGDPVGYIARKYRKFMKSVRNLKKEPDIGAVFKAFAGFQVLCPLHHGNRGVTGINRLVEMDLLQQGFAVSPDSWYNGRPVLVTRNDYNLDLFNGDIGICLADSTSGEMKVWFERSDGTLRGYSPHRLPRCETVYGMTIHKSQGSEFDEVLVVLPQEDNRILSRELIYTAVTRAKRAVTIVADRELFCRGVSRKLARVSGLADLIEKQRGKTS